MFFIGHNFWREKVQTLDKDETFSVHVLSTCVHIQNRSIRWALVNSYVSKLMCLKQCWARYFKKSN